ncbi:Rha family transcriptional regulator [Salmonella enterica subsp. enterica serovar Derby]|uniref:Peptidase n=6 Tax=Salmonella enterica TaxID=28901 RepID=A0A5W9HSF1_SALDE|nr:peptidase [Salmonella enterica subsp. enterica serovar Derby]EAC0557040.1 peptidase [Salmonella enterica subsp. enterica serovar Richmond]EAX3677084.1 peptidase [Salmonella enterica]EBV1473620.1 peptidase [Salmonella enterica subsp. enterica serovar Stanleyville]ECI4106374.1 peptidase [Salmonella enterica subsp. salamae]ECJ1634203.1 peptidase [Salmonella enterica subsp. enterica serovar Tennessee]ECY9910635.1 peptidase [Salmonella enterica subsp. enterica serovar Muenchen]EDL3629616.1 pep
MNSLTVNNRLSQQPGMYEYRPLRHECRLSNSLVVRNHREHSLTVGDESCRNLTAGFGMEGDFMSMLFAGNQKLSALSICARAIRMSVLALCGNSGVILLSVKRQEHIDSAIPGRYTVQAPYKAGAGIGVLEFNIEHNRAHAVFSCHEHCYAQIMVGRAGASQDAPGSMLTGYANPVRLTTSVIGVPCGEFFEFNIGAVTMTTLPTLAQPEIRIINGQAVTSSQAVADYFIKRHDNVIQKIKNLECSSKFAALNFKESEYTDATGRKLPCYNITRDGFAFLAMGFTGKRAAQFKEAYINAFNQMEKQLSKPSVLSDAAHNASVLYSYISSIHQVWLQQLYPMLEKAESPLAVSLHDRINDAAALASLINMTLNRSEVRGRK